MVNRCLSAVGMFWMAALLASSQSTSSIGFDTLYVFADVIVDGADNDMADFGFYIPGTIGGLVWNDAPRDNLKEKGNGILDLDEGEDFLGLEGINVTLYDAETDKPIDINSTNEKGHYTFEVPYGRYRVVVGEGQYFPRGFDEDDKPVINYKESPWGINTDHVYFVLIDKDNLKNTTVNFGLQILEFP